MRLLVLGGTVFLGRHLVEAALGAGHEVTLFNRGRTNPGLFPGAEQITGDRNTDLHRLEGTWDAVVDTCAYVPHQVERAAAQLAGQVGHYDVISSISVYDGPAVGADEEAPLLPMPDDAPADEVTGGTYGPLKTACELAARDGFGADACVVRPGLIVGPHDPSDRFTYWPTRLARGGEVLAPGDPDGPVQYVDARDLAAWLLQLAEGRVTGTFNATGPAARQTRRQLLETIAPDAELTWVDEGFLLAHEVGPFMELPLWVPASSDGFMSIDCRRAHAAGLRHRPLAEIAADTLVWDRTRPAGERKAGLTAEREAELLAAWHARTSG